MEAPLQTQYGSPFEPLAFSLGHITEPLSHIDPESCPGLNTEHDSLLRSSFSPNGTCPTDNAGLSTTISSALLPEEEQECLVDSQPICFKENPFLVANRKGKGLPAREQILSGPPVGYGRQGQLQPWLYSKARSCLWVVWRQHGVLLQHKSCSVTVIHMSRRAALDPANLKTSPLASRNWNGRFSNKTPITNT